MRALARLILPLLLLGAPAATAVHAQTQPPQAAAPPSAADREAERRAAWTEAADAATAGPASVPLRDQAKLDLPKGMVFIPQQQATRLSRALGNHPGPSMVGMITTLDDDSEWMVIINWIPDGYIKDDEAKDLDATAILDQLKEGTVEGNKDRLARGFPELELTGWIQPPHYDATRHQLAWSLGVKQKGEPAGAETTVNFNTRALGRNGYFSLNLITGQNAIDKDRAVATTLLTNLHYDEGKRYTDFNESTDRVAAYGLAALIGVAAAKKLGLLAVVGLFVAKFAKVGLLAVGGIGIAIARLFKRKPGA